MSQPPTAPPKVRIRGMILTAGIAAITIMGTVLGAGLKAERETKQKQKVLTDPGAEDDLIAALETRRRGLVQTKIEWEKKEKNLRERIESNSQRSIGGGSSTSTAPSGK